MSDDLIKRLGKSVWTLDQAEDRIEELERKVVILMRDKNDALDQVSHLKEKVEQFRDTNRRMNRRVQLLEGWWQRRVEHAKYWSSVYLRNMKVKGGVDPKALEEVAYQRGYEDGFEQKFVLPKRSVKPRRLGEKNE
jgi:chromosome segregation ATPase